MPSCAFVEIQPNRFRRSPHFDKKGRPLDYLDHIAADAEPTKRHQTKQIKRTLADTFTRAMLMQELFAHGYM